MHAVRPHSPPQRPARRSSVAGALVLFVALAVGACASIRGGASDAALPNVIVIVTDDQGWADVGYNNPAAYTPNIDALALSGVTFTEHYSMPQCTPTRVALMTGRYPSRFGGAALQASNQPAFPVDTPTLARLFADRGYETFLCGKWHLGSTPGHGPNDLGFEASYGSLAGAVGMYDHRYRKGEFYETWHRDQAPIEGHENGVHATDLVADEAIRFLERERDRPFFLYLAFHAVHTPLDERGRFVERPTQLDPASPPDRPRWLDEDEIEWFHDTAGKVQREEDPERRLFLAALHHLDHAIGRVVHALDREGLREDTLVVFTSDNGPQVDWSGNAYPDDLALTDFNQPSPWRGKKVDVWEGGIRVPGCASWPGRIEPATVDTPVHVVDWFPTFARLIGADAPHDLDGEDLTGLLTSGASLPVRDLYWTWSQVTDRWALRRGNWKIVHYGTDEPSAPADWLLFDLAADPGETTDVGEANPVIRARLHARFRAQRKRDGLAGTGTSGDDA